LAERRPSAIRRFGVLARFGHFARGVVYLAMGIWTARAAIVSHARAVGPGEALKAVFGFRQGHVLVGLAAAGFFADAVFRLVQAMTERSRGIVRRVSFFLRGVASAALGTTAIQVYRNVRLQREGDFLRSQVAWVMAHPWGAKTIVAIGGIAGIAGAREILEGLTGRLRETFVKKTMGRHQKRWATRLARVGLAAHGVLVAATGFFLVRAGLAANPRSAVESGGALRRVGALPFGSALLAGLAVGLIAYGLSQWVFGFYRRGT